MVDLTFYRSFFTSTARHAARSSRRAEPGHPPSANHRPTRTDAYLPGIGLTPPGGGTALTTSAQTYDAAGNVLTATDGRGTVTTFSYDPTGLVLSEKQPTSSTSSITTSFGYDLNGSRTRFTDGRGNAF